MGQILKIALLQHYTDFSTRSPRCACRWMVAGTMKRRQSPPMVSGGNGSDENTGAVKKGPWTPEEDTRLVNYIQKHGHGSWKVVAKLAGLNRCGKSCRLRWTNYLRPDLKRGKFTEEEEQLIIKLHSVIGNKWSAIATRLPGRTDNEIKNHWNTHLRKRLLQMGIDPTTHRPVTDFNLINVLANLTQLLAVVANSGNNSNLTINPDWDSINALRLCSDAAQIVNQHNLMTLLQSQLQSNTINNTAANEAQNQIPGPAAQIGGMNQILDHLALLYPSMQEVQIPHLSFATNETNQGNSVMDVSSSASSSFSSFDFMAQLKISMAYVDMKSIGKESLSFFMILLLSCEINILNDCSISSQY